MTKATELLALLREFLADRVQPRLDSYPAFENRIASNLLALLEREVRLAPALNELDVELAQNHALGGGDVPRELALALRDGRLSTDPGLRRDLVRRALLHLAIDNPRYSGFKQALGKWPDLAEELPWRDDSAP